MNKTKKWFFYSSFLCVLLCFITLIYISNIEVFYKKNYLIILTFILIGIKSLKEIISDNYEHSINKVFWYFNFIFFFIAPLIQYLSDYTPMDYYIEERLYLKANLLILIWVYAYSFFRKLNININVDRNIKYSSITLNKSFLKFLLIINIFILLIMIRSIGLANLFIREKNSLPILSGFLNLILDNGMRVVPVFSTIYSYYYLKHHSGNKLYIIVFSIITLILNFPTSNTRYFIGVVYIGIIVTIFKSSMKNRKFDLFFIILLFAVFPIFQMFKWYTINDFFSGNINFNSVFNSFNNMDFDAYTMFQRIILYTEMHGCTLGNQILSTALFFIPRSIWPNKPIPTGEFVATSQNSLFTNLSSPLISEAYIDFGVLGILIFAIALSTIIAKLDKLYFCDNKNGLRYIDYVYPFALGFCIFMMRGALQPVVVFMFVFFLPLASTKLVKFRKRSRA